MNFLMYQKKERHCGNMQEGREVQVSGRRSILRRMIDNPPPACYDTFKNYLHPDKYFEFFATKWVID